jgi:hypothetical protein
VYGRPMADEFFGTIGFLAVVVGLLAVLLDALF